MGTEVADTEAAEIKDTAAPEPTAETIEREAEETIEEGSVAVEDEESSASAEDEISEDDEEEKEEEEDPERLSELEILPGKTAYINFYYTIDPEIEGMKDQKVDFSFAYTLEDEEGKQTKNTLRETFRYAVDALNLMTVTAGGEKGYVETGKEDEMLLEFDLGLMREVLEEAIEEELEKTENGDASAAEAKRASASELLVGWEDENGERPLGKKDPAVIKNLKCEVETFGVKLDKFKAIPVKDDDNFGTSLKCSFYVSRKTLPGTYYGRVNASYKIKGKSFHTTQGFKVVVKQETGEMELVGKIGDSEIVMTGPVSSFPKADELSLKVSEITQEQQEKVDEALQKKAEEEGSEISQYKALDIKLMADGVETEPEGDVQVRFKNVNLEKVDEKKEAEQEKAEEQSIVKKAVRKVMSLFSARDEEEDVAAVAETGTEGEAESKDSEDGKAEGSEEGAGESGETAENSENIKVLHLDEDAVVANEMKSEVQENGDVVMDTDHFSIYIMVDMPVLIGNIKLTVQHWAEITYPDGADGEDGLIPSDGPDNIALNATARINTKTEFTEIYAPDYISLDNQIKRTPQQISKICMLNKSIEKNYDLKEVWVLKENGSANSTINNDSANWNIYPIDNTTNITLTKDSTIRLKYLPKEADEFKPGVTFYDYNVTDGNVQEINGKNVVDTNNKGINTESNYKEEGKGKRIAVGQISNVILHDYETTTTTGDTTGQFLNQGNRKDNKSVAVKNMVIGVTDQGPLYKDGINDPGLFNSGNITGKEITTEYSLGFSRKGDTYTLTNLYHGTKKTRSDLNILKDYYDYNQYGSKQIFSNNFWPLDDFEYDERDPMLGKWNGEYFTNGKKSTHSVYYGLKNGVPAVMPRSDDFEAHNYFFGMRYDFEFTLGDYVGPLKYYFRGDDDFWLFVDGKLKADLGGIHSSMGQLVDLNYLKNEPKDKTHHLTVLYTERGGTGSCCYMQFVLPEITPIIPNAENLKKTIKIEKKWVDEQSSYREPITVNLLYQYPTEDGKLSDWIKYKQYILTAADAVGNSNVWEKDLGNFPVKSLYGEYRYKLEEVDVPDGYVVSYPNGSTTQLNELSDSTTMELTNTRQSNLTVEVEKKWDDVNGNAPDENQPKEIYMQLQYKKANESNYTNFASGSTGTTGRLILDGEIDTSPTGSAYEYAPWKGKFENLPEYIDDQAVTYRVRELKKVVENGEDKFIVLEDDNSKLPGEHTENPEDYTVTYTPSDPEEVGSISKTTVTNTLTTDRYVTKNWEDVPGGITPKAKIGLYTNNRTEANPEWILVKDYVKIYGSDSKITDEDNFITWTQQNEGENKKADVSKEPMDFILELTYDPKSKQCSGGWRDLPKYKDGKEIQYSIFEIDDEGNPIILQNDNTIKTIDGHKYEVSLGINGSNGTGEPGKQPFIITNKYIVELIIAKKIGNTGNSENSGVSKEFKFTATITKDGVNKTINFTVAANGTVKIPVSIGSTVEIQESKESQAGYYVSYTANKIKLDGTTEPISLSNDGKGDKISITIPDDGSITDINVNCTNTPGAVLPDTGGPGLLMMSRLGWMLLLLALLMAGMEIQFYGERRNRKAANAQREDTRGFDPDDY